MYTVPPRCDFDGARIPTPLMRRLKRPDPRRRVVVVTTEGTVIFAMYSARKLADRIASELDIERRPDA